MRRLLSRKLLARHRRHPAVRWLGRAAGRLIDGYHNLNHHPESNGEAFVLRRLAAGGLGRCGGIVVDVGACYGRWTQLARAALPSLPVHCFEIAPAVAADLRRNLAGDPAVTVNPVGLWNRDGTVRLRYFPTAQVLSTVTDIPLAFPEQTIAAPVRRGDTCLAELGDPAVAMLKIDAEGAEREVLEGFDRAFARGRIAVAQLEYGPVNIVTRFLLRDMYAFFEARDFAFGKIYPGYVDFRPYELADEDFRGPNYLAVRNDRPELIAALR